MPSDPRLTKLDLLVVGGLTVDHLPDGTTVPGGSVLHAPRAVASAGHRVGVVASAGPEREATIGVAELRSMGFVQLQSVERSIAFEHLSVGGTRQLRFLGSGQPLVAAPPSVTAGVVIFAPVAGELRPDLGGQLGAAARRAAILQGWLRRLAVGELVTPLPLGALDPELRKALSGMDVLIASREDLAAEGDTPPRQLGALRGAVGPGPVLVLTNAAEGAWFDAGGERWQQPVPRRVDGSSIGAGDMFAALLVAPGWPVVPDRGFLSRRADSAMRAVADLLSRRA
jgi:sugar/nucleoside kinase (ribokinase family)